MENFVALYMCNLNIQEKTTIIAITDLNESERHKYENIAIRREISMCDQLHITKRNHVPQKFHSLFTRRFDVQET